MSSQMEALPGSWWEEMLGAYIAGEWYLALLLPPLLLIVPVDP